MSGICLKNSVSLADNRSGMADHRHSIPVAALAATRRGTLGAQSLHRFVHMEKEVLLTGPSPSR